MSSKSCYAERSMKWRNRESIINFARYRSSTLRSLMKAKFHVLVVEDDRAIRKLLHRQLVAMGMSVHLARDGKEGYTLWANHPYDLVLTDCSMPQMDGFELASKIRSAGRFPASLVPIVAITGLSTDCESRSATGINDFISKPVVTDDLHRTIRRWLPGSIPELAETGAPPVSERYPVMLSDSAIMRSITGMFIKSIPDYLEALGQATVAGSPTDIAAAAHKLKSAARLVDGNHVAELCETLERRAHGASSEEISMRSIRIHRAARALGNSLKSRD